MHVVLSDKAYLSIISDVLRRNTTETGGLFLGRIHKKIWYVVDVIDEGIQTENYQTFFSWDTQYVNHLAVRISTLYKEPLTILGFWHRHPQSYDRFSRQDEQTIQSHLQDAKFGLISMLVNVDPDLRMTFYWCHDMRIMETKYDIGDEYFAPEFLQFAKPEELIALSRTPNLRIKKNRKNDPALFVKSTTEQTETPTYAGRAPVDAGQTYSASSMRQAQTGSVTGRSESNNQQILETISAGISSHLQAHFSEIETSTRAVLRRAVDTQDRLQQSANTLNGISGDLRKELENQTDTLTNIREALDVVRLTQKRDLIAIQSSIDALQKRIDRLLPGVSSEPAFPNADGAAPKLAGLGESGQENIEETACMSSVDQV